ncbi:MAG: cbb3-type cytochrome c oxidase subunit 3 [Cycloclasticus sp.]
MFDLDILRSIVTVALFCLFIALIAWAWSKDRKDEFEEAANLPFEGNEISKDLQGSKK